jgi:predicted phosphate transport protein (TIGR00153 family)
VTFLFRSQKRIEEMIGTYLEHFLECAQSFSTGMKCYLEKGTGADFDYWVNRTHKEESSLDDLRRSIEMELYSKTLLPESRGDILGLLETADRIPNKLESVLFQIQCENIRLPAELIEDLENLLQNSCDSCRIVTEAIRDLFHKREKIQELTRKIDQVESFCDQLERRIITKIFKSDLEIGEKVLLKQLILQIGDIADGAESVSDRIIITSVKGQI